MEMAIFDVVFGGKPCFMGIVGGVDGIFATTLPMLNREDVKCELSGLVEGELVEGAFEREIRLIRDYFGGEDCLGSLVVDFSGLSEFAVDILGACRGVGFGETVSYSELAVMAGRENSSRAVGNVLGKNRLPVIVPCHRVIRADGGIGGFMGGKENSIEIKKTLILNENPLFSCT